MEKSGIAFYYIPGPLHRPLISIDGVKELLDECFSGVGQTRASMPCVKESHPYLCFNVVNRATHPGLDRVQPRGRSRFASFLRHRNDAFQFMDGHVVRHFWPRQQNKRGAYWRYPPLWLNLHLCRSCCLGF